MKNPLNAIYSACFNCKRSHLSCNKERPCSRCISKGDSTVCIGQEPPILMDQAVVDTLFEAAHILVMLKNHRTDENKIKKRGQTNKIIYKLSDKSFGLSNIKNSSVRSSPVYNSKGVLNSSIDSDHLDNNNQSKKRRVCSYNINDLLKGN